TVTGAGGVAIPNRTVTFAVTAGGGSLSVLTVNTNSQGQASTTLTLGPGTNTVTATPPGLSGSPVTFNATSQSGPPTGLTLMSGNNQSGSVGQALSNPLVVKVTDANGNAVSGVAASFAVTSGGGTLTGGITQVNVNTDANGLASVILTL